MEEVKDFNVHIFFNIFLKKLKQKESWYIFV